MHDVLSIYHISRSLVFNSHNNSEEVLGYCMGANCTFNLAHKHEAIKSKLEITVFIRS